MIVKVLCTHGESAAHYHGDVLCKTARTVAIDDALFGHRSNGVSLPQNLNLLADLCDAKWPGEGTTEVQDDLRAAAHLLEDLRPPELRSPVASVLNPCFCARHLAATVPIDTIREGRVPEYCAQCGVHLDDHTGPC